MYTMHMYSNPLYKSCQPCPLGPFRPRPRGIIICHRLIMGNTLSTCKFSLVPQDTKLVYCIQQLYMELYINRVNHAPGIQNGTTLGVISSINLQWKTKNKKQTKTITKQHTQKHFSETTWLRSFIFVCSN